MNKRLLGNGECFMDDYDEQFLIQAAQGDLEAFGILYEKNINRIYNYVYYRTGNNDDAEDLTAKVFIRAMQHITRYQNRGLPFSAWLYRIAHNLVANWYRDSSRRKETPLDDGIENQLPREYPELELVKLEEEEQLLKLLRKLPADRQQLIILKFVEQLSNTEIGIIMGKSEGAIKSLYHRTLQSLRDSYNYQ